MAINEKKSPVMFEFPVKVYYEDTDAGGVVYHANYLKFMERARSEFLISKGCSVVRCEQEFQVIFVVRHIDIDYSLPAKLGDDLIVDLQVIKLGKVGMLMKQCVYNAEGLLICSALVKLAALSRSANGSYSLNPMPEKLLKILSADSYVDKHD